MEVVKFVFHLKLIKAFNSKFKSKIWEKFNKQLVKEMTGFSSTVGAM